MTEQQWLTSDDPEKMLAFLLEVTGSTYGGPAERDRCPSDRKLRLWVAACFGLSTFNYIFKKKLLTWQDGRPLPDEGSFPLTRFIEEWATSRFDCNGDPSLAERAALLRDIVGNPFRPIDVFARAPSKWGGWVTPDVLALARAAYEERPGANAHLDPVRLAILADALEEAGCDNETILRHLRGLERPYECGVPAEDMECRPCGVKLYRQRVEDVCRARPLPHVRGCWVLDLILGKS